MNFNLNRASISIYLKSETLDKMEAHMGRSLRGIEPSYGKGIVMLDIIKILNRDFINAYHGRLTDLELKNLLKKGEYYNKIFNDQELNICFDRALRELEKGYSTMEIVDKRHAPLNNKIKKQLRILWIKAGLLCDQFKGIVLKYVIDAVSFIREFDKRNERIELKYEIQS